MVKIWKGFEEATSELFDFVNGKQVVLWGYQYNGFFLAHLFSIRNKKIEMIVDDGDINPRIPIYRSCELYDISPRCYSVIISGNKDTSIESFLNKKGFKKNVNYIYANDLYFRNEKRRQLSYFGYLESVFDVDILERKKIETMEIANADCFNYSPGIGYGLANVLEEFNIHKNDAVFDFGCGKGGAIILFNKYGFTKYGGVEYDKCLYKILSRNFDILGLDKTYLINADAATVELELDSFNYFFMYNPFAGDLFSTVIKNIELSWERKPRKIILIYSGIYCHEKVIANGYFVVSKKIYTDYSVRNVYIYMIEGCETEHFSC